MKKMDLYPKSSQQYSDEVFQNPPAQYRGTPFWAWNTRLDKKRLEEQICVLKEMGMGGFHIHSRIGLNTEYLGPEFMEDVRFCIDRAKELGMRCWLYDEDKWPSGYGGGRVTKNPEYRNKFLLFSPERKEDGYMRQKTPKQVTRLAAGGQGRLLARYDVELRDGKLEGYRLLAESDKDTVNTWFAYLVTAEASPWFNSQSYADTLNPKATEHFIKEVHERYAAAVGEEFSGAVPAIFTDEPQFSQKDNFSFAKSEEELKIPYTEDLEHGFCRTYGCSLLESLPELFWELPEGVSEVRYKYHDYVAERFARAYADTIGAWCRNHGLLLTGHVMEEAELGSQTRALGEAMRQYRGFGLPGVDMLADRYEYNTVKQAQSAAHQYGCPGVLSELYGVTNWDFDFRGHKRQGDWQAALGVTQRVHHLSWLCMKGEAKRDYPAPIDEHSPWYPKYHLIEDYFARINSALTRGKPLVHIGVVHPIESYWLYYGPNDQTGEMRKEMEEEFSSLAEWLIFHLLDFDYICESQLPSQYTTEGDGKFHVGKMAYEVVVVPPLKTIRKSTLNCLKEFADMGGHVLWLGEKPEYIDALSAEKSWFSFGENAPFEAFPVRRELEQYQEISVYGEDGTFADRFISQIRQDGEDRWVFLAPGKKEERACVPQCSRNILRIRGCWKVWEYCALDGKRKEVLAAYERGYTECRIPFYEDDSLLLRLIPQDELTASMDCGRQNILDAGGVEARKQEGYLQGPEEYSLSEPNVLLLDRAEFWVDGNIQAEGAQLEVIKIEDILRKKLGYSLRSESYPQPWLENGKTQPVCRLTLRFTFESEVVIKDAKLAAESEQGWDLVLNGKPCIRTEEFWLDQAFTVYRLPQICSGSNELVFQVPFGEQTALEWSFLLGEFGAETDGSSLRLTRKPETIQFGDLTRQGFPFFGGNIVYHTELKIISRKHVTLQIPNYSGSLVSARAEGKEEQYLFCSPYTADLGILEKGKHRVEITIYGNRRNTFGQLHHCDRNEEYFGPKTWRTEGAAWSCEYQLQPMGILSSPVIYSEDE